MAEIDKTLPTTDLPPVVAPDVEIPVADETKLIETEGIEATELPDGGMDINFDPSSKLQIPGTEGHFDNLADLLPDDILTPIGSDMQADYTDYKQSRKEWEDTYIKGLDLLGFQYKIRTEPFQGASGATHPVLAEAVTQFQALAYKELLPADGPVRTMVMGVSNPQKEQQSQRVKNFMNYQLMDQMKEYEPEFDQM